MIDTRVNIDMDNILPDTKQLFFNNLQLLGFDVLAMEATNHIPFNKAMFELPNKRGAELVLHYLFQRLNPTMCREAFRDCWPIIDKKREQGFRKTCSNWLTNISQEEPNSHLPRINASLFMSPGGDKFYQLLFYFSGYILQRVIGTELGSKMSERLKYPLLTSQNLQQGDVMVKALTCSSIRCRTSYFSNVQTHVNASKSWKDTADEYVREYRKMNKEIRELDYTVRGEEQKSVAASVARGSPAKRRSGQADHFDPEFDPRTIKRAQRVQQVRDMWKQLEDFDQTEAAEREVVESIVERTINKYRLDAADISVKVPDMLLRECGNEIRRRNVDNTYQGGRLNLVSVLQLWNLSLHLYLEKINQVGVPTFEEEVRELTSQVHVQQNYAQNAQTLREQMSVRVPVLKSSIEKLREKLDSALFQDQTPDTIRTTSVGLGLVGPSPLPSFSPENAKTPLGGIGVPRSPGKVIDTPEGASKVTEQMKNVVRRGPDQLFKQPDLLKLGQRTEEASSIPKLSRSQTSSRQSSRPTSARSTTSSKASVRSTRRSSKHVQKQSRPADTDPVFSKVTIPRSMMEKLQLEDSLPQEVETGLLMQPLSARSDWSNASTCHTLSARSDKSSTSLRTVKSGSSEACSVTDRGDYSRSIDQEYQICTGRKTPTDLLVEEIMGEGKILSPFNSGMEAFETHIVIRRTPDIVENTTSESITPTNELFDDNNDQDINEQFVDIQGPEIDLNKDMNDIEPSGDFVYEQCDTIRYGSFKVDVKSREESRESLCRPADVEEVEAKPRDMNNGDVRWLDEGKEVSDDIVEGMIAEGIKQVSQDGLRDSEDDTVQYPAGTRSYAHEGEDILFQNVCGPDLEDIDNMSEVSQRSTEAPIVIDRSVHASPTAYRERVPRLLRSPESPEMLIEEEKFPSLETSPFPRSPEMSIEEEKFHSLENSLREAIIIDRSFQTQSKESSAEQPFSPTGNQSASGVGIQYVSPGALLSMSFQGRMTPSDNTSMTRGLLSQSLVMERSPLSEEIRKMFQKAVKDTLPCQPSHEEHLSPNVQHKYDIDNELELPHLADTIGNRGNSIDSSLGHHRNILKASDISWDLTENLDDVELPAFDEDIDDNENLLEAGDRVTQLVELNDDAIDDFFSSKTPELPKRRTLVTSEGSRTSSKCQGQFERSLGEGSSMEWPSFPHCGSIEDESPLFATFTP